MKNFILNKTITFVIIAWSGAFTLNAQTLTNDQKAVWQEVENKWINWKTGNLDVAFSYIHNKFLGWNEVDSIPVTKDDWGNSMKAMQQRISDINFSIEPVKIIIHNHSAVVHYYFQYSFLYSDGNKSQIISDHGKWSEFLVNENGNWMLIGEFTFHQNASKKMYSSNTETFTFSSGGNDFKGKIYLPAAYKTNKNLPAIYLIDFTEQHFKIATDEFEKVIEGVQQLIGFDALVVSLDGIPDIDAEPESFQKHYEIYKDMAAYIDNKYTFNNFRTFIGKGSEGGVVLMALFIEDSTSSMFDNFIVTDPSPKYATEICKMIENKEFPQNKSSKKLHFSFSTSNDRMKCTQLIKLLNDANYPWLDFKSVEYTESNYENTYPIAFAAGIQYMFKNEK